LGSQDYVNIHDKNAIEVRHSNKGAKVGYLSRGLALQLAPLIDQEMIEVEGVLLEGKLASFGRPNQANPDAEWTELMNVASRPTVPNATVGVKEIPIGIEIYGTRIVGRDSRLDFAFATRAKRAAEASRAKKEAEERARHDRQLKQELEEHNARIERSQSRGAEHVRCIDPAYVAGRVGVG